MDMKLELVPVPVTNVDAAKSFYVDKAGFHADIDQRLGDVRFVQLTPPGSGCSIVIGEGVTTQRPGSIDGILLAVANAKMTYAELTGRGVEMTEPKKMPWGAIHADFKDPDGNRWTIQEKAVRG